MRDDTEITTKTKVSLLRIVRDGVREARKPQRLRTSKYAELGLPTPRSNRIRRDQPLKQSLLCVQAIFGLVPDPRARTVDDLGRDFLATVGR